MVLTSGSCPVLSLGTELATWILEKLKVPYVSMGFVNSLGRGLVLVKNENELSLRPEHPRLLYSPVLFIMVSRL